LRSNSSNTIPVRETTLLLCAFARKSVSLSERAKDDSPNGTASGLTRAFMPRPTPQKLTSLGSKATLLCVVATRRSSPSKFSDKFSALLDAYRVSDNSRAYLGDRIQRPRWGYPCRNLHQLFSSQCRLLSSGPQTQARWLKGVPREVLRPATI